MIVVGGTVVAFILD